MSGRAECDFSRSLVLPLLRSCSTPAVYRIRFPTSSEQRLRLLPAILGDLAGHDLERLHQTNRWDDPRSSASLRRRAITRISGRRGDLRRVSSTYPPLVSLIYLVSQQKSAHHQSGTVYVTTHRLFYYSTQSPDKYSFSFDLAHITQTDYYAGLFTSSPKVTLHLGSLDDVDVEEDVTDGWECDLCSYRNPPGASRNAQVCTLCGVPRNEPSDPSAGSRSLPSSRSITPFSSEIACTMCTFLNPASSKACEICGTPLPGMRSGTAPPSPALKPISDSDPRLIRVSFRKGGDKNIYAILKRSLQGKAWEVGQITVLRCRNIDGQLPVETSGHETIRHPCSRHRLVTQAHLRGSTLLLTTLVRWAYSKRGGLRSNKSHGHDRRVERSRGVHDQGQGHGSSRSRPKRQVICHFFISPPLKHVVRTRRSYVHPKLALSTWA